MRGKQGVPHPDPEGPPRRRANRRRGHGTFANDRPPVAGVVGRDSGEARLEVLASSGGAELDEVIDSTSLPGATACTDEWRGYGRVGGRHGRAHRTVDHSGPKGSWAPDLDGNGVREVHGDTQEGLWTGLGNFLRPSRGVSKWYLAQYVAVFQWGHNIRRVTDESLWALLGTRPSTGPAL
jgi:hypothetical protein